MTPTRSPLHRSIGLSGGFRLVLAMVAVVAVVGAFATGMLGLGIAGAVILVAAVGLGFQARRARLAAAADLHPRRRR